MGRSGCLRGRSYCHLAYERPASSNCIGQRDSRRVRLFPSGQIGVPSHVLQQHRTSDFRLCGHNSGLAPLRLREWRYRIPGLSRKGLANNSNPSQWGDGMSHGPGVLHRHRCLVVLPPKTSEHDLFPTPHCTLTVLSFRLLPT